nr:hypothetical protein CFP56_60567 [Quercus suber]
MLAVGELGLGNHVGPLYQDPMQSLRPIGRIRLDERETVNDLEIKLKGWNRKRNWEDSSDDPDYVVDGSSRGALVVKGVGVGASWLVGGLVDRGFEVTIGCTTFELCIVVLALRLSSSSTSTWESIYFDSFLDSGLSKPFSSSLLSSPCPSAWVSTVGSSGSGTWLTLLKRESSGRPTALMVAI